MNLLTPNYDLKNYPNVYEPREDTFLFLDALESEIIHLKCLRPLFALEIGSGSGAVITSLSFIFQKQCFYFATDINAEACLATCSTALLNNSNIEVLNTNLADGLRNSFFDLLLFNPPYVETGAEEFNDGAINKAWAGGIRGREIIDTFIGKLPEILSNQGICYLLLSKQNDPLEISNVVSKMGFKSNIILERKIIGEHLFVIKVFRDL